MKSFSTRFFYLFGALLLSLPLSIFLTNLLGLLVFLNTFTVPKKVLSENRLMRPLSLSFLAFYLCYAISLLWSENWGDGWIYLGPKIAFVLMPIALSIGAPALATAQVQKLKNIFVFGVTLACIYSIGDGFYHYFDTGDWYRYWPSGTIRDHHLFYTGLGDPLMHPGYFSVYVGIAFFLIIERLRNASKKWPHLLLVAFMIIFLFMLQGRINIIAFALSFGFYLIATLIRQNRLKLLAGLFASVIILSTVTIFIAPDSVKERFTPSLSLDYDLSSPSIENFSGFTIRLAEWHCAADVIKSNLWLGTGVTDAQDKLMESYQRNGFRVGLERKFNAHNQFLQTLMTTGIPGLLALLLIFIFLLRSAYRQGNVYFAMIVVYFFLSMITESMLERHWAITLLSSLILFFGLQTRESAREV